MSRLVIAFVAAGCGRIAFDPIDDAQFYEMTGDLDEGRLAAGERSTFFSLGPEQAH